MVERWLWEQKVEGSIPGSSRNFFLNWALYKGDFSVPLLWRGEQGGTSRAVVQTGLHICRYVSSNLLAYLVEVQIILQPESSHIIIKSNGRQTRIFENWAMQL